MWKQITLKQLVNSKHAIESEKNTNENFVSLNFHGVNFESESFRK